MLSSRFAPKNICFKIARSPSGSLADVDTPDELLDAVEAHDADNEGKEELKGRMAELKERLEAEETKITSITREKIAALHAALDVSKDTSEAIEDFMNEMKEGVETPEKMVVEQAAVKDPTEVFQVVPGIKDIPNVIDYLPPTQRKAITQDDINHKKKIESLMKWGNIPIIGEFLGEWIAKFMEMGEFSEVKEREGIKKMLIEEEQDGVFENTFGKIASFTDLSDKDFDDIIIKAKKIGIDLANAEHVDAALMGGGERSISSSGKVGPLHVCHCFYYAMCNLPSNISSDPAERIKQILTIIKTNKEALSKEIYAENPVVPTPPPAPEETIEEETKLTLSEDLRTSVTTIMSEINADGNGALRRYLFTGEDITDTQENELGNTNNALNGFKSKTSLFIEQVANTGILEKIGYQGEWNDSTPAQTIALVAAEIAYQAELETRGADHLKQQLVQDYAESWHKYLTDRGLSVKLEDISIEEPVMTSGEDLFKKIKPEMKKDIDKKVLVVTKEQAKEALQSSVKKEGEDLTTYIKNLENAFHDNADKAQLLSFLETGFKKTVENVSDFPELSETDTIDFAITKYFEDAVVVKHLAQTLRNRITVFSNTDSKGRLGGMTWDDGKKISTYEAKNLINLARIEEGNYLAASTGLMSHLDTDKHETDESIKNSSEELNSIDTIKKVIREKVKDLNPDKSLSETLITRLQTQLEKGREEKEYIYYIMGELEAKIAQLKKQNSTKLAESIRELGRQNFTTLVQWQKGEFEPFVPKEEANITKKSQPTNTREIPGVSDQNIG